MHKARCFLNTVYKVYFNDKSVFEGSKCGKLTGSFALIGGELCACVFVPRVSRGKNTQNKIFVLLFSLDYRI